MRTCFFIHHLPFFCREIKFLQMMKNENNVFGKVTHDNLPQAVEHLIKMMEEQAQNSKNNMSVEDDEISIEEVSSLIKKILLSLKKHTTKSVSFVRKGALCLFIVTLYSSR